MFTLTLCVLREEATRQRKYGQGVKALLQDLCKKHSTLFTSDFQSRFLQPLRVLKYPYGERPTNDLYSNSFILDNGLELLIPKHEPILFQQVMKLVVNNEAQTFNFDYNDEELIFIIETNSSEDIGAALQLELQILNEAMLLLDSDLDKASRLTVFQNFCRQLLADPQPAFWLPRTSEIKHETIQLLDDLKDIGAVNRHWQCPKLKLQGVRLETVNRN